MARFFPLPDAGDIVWCRFPNKGLDGPRPKPRPALVVDIGELRGDPAIEVLYGTSQKLDRLYPGEFAITREDGELLVIAGLDRPTKFDMRRTVYLPYSDEWFGVAPGAPYGQTPKLGLLHPSLLSRAKAALQAVK